MKLKKRLENSLPRKELDHLVTSYDVVGDIAITIIPEVLKSKEKVIAEKILESNNKIKVVVKRAGNYGGEFRTIPLTFLAGEDRKETEVKESGIRLLVNPEIVYYSVRSGNERRRIASLVEPGESVLVLFSGIAPYPLVIAKHSEAHFIVGVEKNPEAHRYGIKNLSCNKKLRNIRLYLGDVAEILPTLSTPFDRVIMPLPKDGKEFLAQAIDVLTPGGCLHFYDMQHPDEFGRSEAKIIAACEGKGRTVVRSSVVKCGHCAPQLFRICIDARIS